MFEPASDLARDHGARGGASVKRFATIVTATIVLALPAAVWARAYDGGKPGTTPGATDFQVHFTVSGGKVRRLRFGYVAFTCADGSGNTFTELAFHRVASLPRSGRFHHSETFHSTTQTG